MNTIAAPVEVSPRRDLTPHLGRPISGMGGFAAGAVLVAFGIAAIVMGFDGRSTVSDNLGQEKIVGTPT